MNPKRKARLDSLIKSELSLAIPRIVKDPRVVPLTVTRLETTNDVKEVTVYFTILGEVEFYNNLNDLSPYSNEEHVMKLKKCQAGLRSSHNSLRRHLAKELRLKHIPKLIFKEDKGLDHSIRIGAILKSLNKEKNEKELS